VFESQNEDQNLSANDFFVNWFGYCTNHEGGSKAKVRYLHESNSRLEASYNF